MSVNCREWSLGSLIAYCPTRNVSSLSPLPLGQKKNVLNFHSEISTANSGAVLRKNPGCPSHAGDDVQANFLSDLWGQLKKLRWHMYKALLSLFSATCKHQLMPWWLKCGKFGSGREKAARGSNQSGGKKKKKTDSLECSQSLEWTVSLPSLSGVPYFSPPSLFFSCFSFSPLFSQSALRKLHTFPWPSYCPPHTAYVSQYLLISAQT